MILERELSMPLLGFLLVMDIPSLSMSPGVIEHPIAPFVVLE